MKQKTQMFLLIIITIILLSSFHNPDLFQGQKNTNLINEFKKSQKNSNEANILTNTTSIFENNLVWSEPLQLTMPILKRGDYKIKQSSDGTLHCIFIKQLTLYGSGFFYMYSNNTSSHNWSFPKQLIQIDTEISEFDMIIDYNSTIHVGFIAKRETVWQVSYISKVENETYLNHNKIIDRSFNNEFSNLNLLLSNNILQMLWISKERNTEDENLESSIISIAKNLLNNVWTQKKIFYEGINPITFSINQLKNNNLVLIISKWNSLFNGNDIYYASSNDNGETWINYTLIYEYNLEIEKIITYASNITGGLHIIWNSNEVYSSFNHLEIYLNGTIRSDSIKLNNFNSDGYFVGFYENYTSGDLWIFYEEYTGLYNLKYRKRLNFDLSWQISTTLLTKSKSLIASFIEDSEENNPILGEFFFKNYDVILSSDLYNNDSLLNEHLILQMTDENGKGSICVDSNKTIHYIWQYNSIYDNKIYYLSKTVNGSYEIHGCITDTSITDAVEPKIALDSKDNIHCFFVADNIITGFDGLYYTYKLTSQANWSKAELVENPTNYAQSENLDVYIDDLDTIHLVWGENKGIYQNRLYYSYKMENEEQFTSVLIHDNNAYTSSIDPSFVIDSYRTLHLVYIKINREDGINYIQYQYKLISQSWTTPLTLTASTQYLLLQTNLEIDSSNTLWMVYLRKYQGELYVVTDGILMEKEYNSAWYHSNTLFTNEVINFHDFFITENDTLVYLQHIKNIPTDTIPDGIIDLVMVNYRIAGYGWSDREQIAINLKYDHKPIGYFDTYSKNIYCVVYDKVSNDVNMHIITRQNDLDGDLLGDEDEFIFGTDPFIVDSDSDNLNDGIEVNSHQTNPALNDTDWDGLNDGIEIINYNSNPLTIDTDNDKLLDGEEVYVWLTNPTSSDTDSDLINDFDEIYIFGTDPTKEDTESDGMPDYWEIVNDLDPISDDSYIDFDSDNLFNIEEYWNNTNPRLNDTDMDGLLDGDEVKIYFTDPLNMDTDEDTINDADEVLVFGTNPLLEDSDQDGFTDREEINAGTDPNDPRDNIRKNKIQKIVLGVIIPTIAISSFYVFFEIRYRIRFKKLIENEMEEQRLENEKLVKSQSD